MGTAEGKRYQDMSAQDATKGSSSNTGRRRRSILKKMASRRLRSTTSQRLDKDSESGNAVPVDDVILLSEKDIVLVEDCVSGETLSTKPGDMLHELGGIRTKTESFADETELFLDTEKLDSSTNDNGSKLQETKGQGQSRKKASRFARFVSRRKLLERSSVHREPSDGEETLHDESSHSTGEDAILAMNEESTQTTCPSTAVLTLDAVDSQPDESDSIVATEDVVVSEKATFPEPAVLTKENSGGFPVVSAVVSEGVTTPSALAKDKIAETKSVVSLEKGAGTRLMEETQPLGSQLNEELETDESSLFSRSFDLFVNEAAVLNLASLSPTSSFMESLPDPLDMFRSSATEKKQTDEFGTPTTDLVESKQQAKAKSPNESVPSMSEGAVLNLDNAALSPPLSPTSSLMESLPDPLDMFRSSATEEKQTGKFGTPTAGEVESKQHAEAKSPHDSVPIVSEAAVSNLDKAPASPTLSPASSFMDSFPDPLDMFPSNGPVEKQDEFSTPTTGQVERKRAEEAKSPEAAVPIASEAAVLNLDKTPVSPTSSFMESLPDPLDMFRSSATVAKQVDEFSTHTTDQIESNQAKAKSPNELTPITSETAVPIASESAVLNLDKAPVSPSLSPTSSFMESLPDPLDMFPLSGPVQKQDEFSTPTTDQVESNQAKAKSPNESVLMNDDAGFPMSTQQSGRDLMLIATVLSKDTTASGADSVWDNVGETDEKEPSQEDDKWVAFDKAVPKGTTKNVTIDEVFGDTFVPMESRYNNVAPFVEKDDDAPSDEDHHTSYASIASSARRTARPLASNSRGEPVAEATLVAQRNVTRVSYADQYSAGRQQPTAFARVNMQLDTLRDECSGLFSACVTAAVESCCILIVIGEEIPEEIAHCCFGTNAEESRRPQEGTRHSTKRKSIRRSKGIRVTKPTSGVRAKNKPIQPDDSDDDFSNVVPATPRRSSFSKARVASVIPVNQVNDSRYKDLKYTAAANVTPSRGGAERSTSPRMVAPGVVVVSSADVDWSPKHDDRELLEDVDRFMIAMRPIKECQEQVRELKLDRTLTREELEKEAWFWRQHEAKWKTRLPFHSGEITHKNDSHFI